jgi:hypothetical protein
MIAATNPDKSLLDFLRPSPEATLFETPPQPSGKMPNTAEIETCRKASYNRAMETYTTRLEKSGRSTPSIWQK